MKRLVLANVECDGRHVGFQLAEVVMRQFSFLCALLMAAPSPTMADEQKKTVTIQDYLGCWISIEPSAITIETDYNKPDQYLVRIESMMLSIEQVGGGREFRDLVKGAFDIWSDSEKFYIPTQYYNGVFNPVVRSIIQGGPGQGNSTFHLEGDQIVMVHHKASERSSDMSVRYLKRIDCKEMLERRAKIHASYRLQPEDEL